ncbi:MAG: c-type cytochrome [Burkholderiales bacterium]|nr:c-type cytochrome [Burkholderiales bacterium]
MGKQFNRLLLALILISQIPILDGCTEASTEQATLSPIAKLGAKAFVDSSLSASGLQSCASCHAPETGHSAPNSAPVQLGGTDLNIQGLRNAQTLRYLVHNPAFHFDESGKPVGGFFWDGRADSLSEQAAGPLLGAREMANPDKAAVVAKIARSNWANEFKQVFGSNIFQNIDLAFEKLTFALQQFQLEDAAFNSFTSKYDAVLRGRATLTEQEARGLSAFNDPNKGNCAACHTSSKAPGGDHPVFTDFSYDNLGIPRNTRISANEDSTYFDLGLCARSGLTDRTDLCGAFKVPTLRNVAIKPSFFHNGKFTTLKDVISFYVQRDTHPEKWYGRNSDGAVKKFDDLPTLYQANVNVTEGPYNRKLSEVPALSDSEIDDVIAFLMTLTDGWMGR